MNSAVKDLGSNTPPSPPPNTQRMFELRGWGDCCISGSEIFGAFRGGGAAGQG